MQVDYIIVGCGLAGIHFCELAINHGKTVLVIDNDSQHSSTVAGGLYNPVVLKRFTPVWKSEEQLELVNTTYNHFENKLGINLDYKIPVYRVFNSIEEQNNWFTASDNKNLSEYLTNTIQKNTNKSIPAPFGFGVVKSTGRIDTTSLVNAYKSYLSKEKKLLREDFTYKTIQIENNSISYQGIQTKNIVFAEGYGLKNNPYFNNLPLKGTKGELITIHAPDLKINFVLKGSVFLIPLGDDLYRVGATYEWEDKSNKTTQKGREELVSKLKTVITCSFEVIEQHAGIRPTVIDRRPLVGTNSEHKLLHVLNGLGTRGVMIAPYVAKQLFNAIEKGEEIDSDINITRF